jgi:hypothetical protein
MESSTTFLLAFNCDAYISASLVAEIAGICHHARPPKNLFKKQFFEDNDGLRDSTHFLTVCSIVQRELRLLVMSLRQVNFFKRPQTLFSKHYAEEKAFQEQILE